ncbi:MAG: FtsX-like permease family protein [Vicinamibacterales bacterium]
MEGRRGTGTDTFMRLRAGVTPEQAAQELSALAANGGVTGSKVQLTSLYVDTTHGYQSTARILAEAVGLILLLACVNVAGLLLARGATRYQELLVRASLGATRGRLVRQLLTESLLLAITGGVFGVLLARASLNALVAVVPLALPPDAPARLSVETLMFAAIISVSSALFFGILPALRLSRLKGDIALANASRRNGPALSRRNGQALIAAEVAVAMVLLAGAGVLLRSFARLMSVDLGFDPSRVVALQVMPANHTPETLATYYPALLDAVRALPSVGYAGAVDNLPLIGVTSMGLARMPGHESAMINMWAVTPGYFEALGIPLLSGRLLRDDDLRTTAPKVVISEGAARKFFGTSSPIGRNLNVFQKDREVVGVVGDVKNSGPLWLRPELNAYLPATQRTSPSVMSLVIRMRPGIAIPFERLKTLAQSLGPRVFVEGIRPGTEWLSKNTATPRHRTELFALLGAFGLTLALVGIFSMTAYAVNSRTREIGIRMALGARADQVVKTILGDAATPILGGMAAGTVGSVFATRLISKFLYNTRPSDPASLVVVALSLVLVGCAAAWIPARRAARIDPTIALRTE